MIELSCPHCGQPMEIPDRYAGQAGTCKRCKRELRVPELAADRIASGATTKKRPAWLLYAIGGMVVVLVGGTFVLIRPDGASKPTQQTVQSANSPEEQLDEAMQLRLQGRYREAIQAFERVRVEHPDVIESFLGLQIASAHAILEDDAEHERLCRWLLDRFAQPQFPYVADQVAKSYLLYPGVDDVELLKKTMLLTQYAVDEGTGQFLSWAYVSHGMANYRLKRYVEASRWLKQSIDHELPIIRALALAFSTMAEFDQGNEASAREFLQLAKNAAAELPKQGERGQGDAEIAELALREAEALFRQTGATPTSITKSPKDQLIDARQLAINGKYREAVRAFEKIRIENPDAVEATDGLHMATAYAILEDQAGHKQLCKWLLDRYAQSPATTDRERAAKAYLLYPGVDDEELLEQAAKLTKYAVENETRWLLQWFNVSHGMAEYRLKRYREASRWLDKEVGNPLIAIQSLALAYSAMAEYSRGNEQKAREVLMDARAAVAKLPEPGADDYRNQWGNVLTSNLALGEAEKLIGSSKAASPPPPEKPTAPQVNSIQLLPADNLDAFTVFMRDHGAGKDPNGAFRLVDGVLVVSGAEVGMLFTNEEYENYRLEVDYKWLSDRPDRDSGIFVNILARDGKEHKPGDKMRAIEVNILGPKMFEQNSLSGQIWLFSQQGDTVKLTVDGQVYTKNTSPAAPPEDFENPVGQWNTMEITSANGKFLVTLNGKVVVEATDPVPSRGKIMLQSSQGEIHFGRMVLTQLE